MLARIIVSLLAFWSYASCYAIEPVAFAHRPGITDNTVVVSIIIDDLGNHLDAGQRAVNLPGALTYAFLPYLRYSRQLARQVYLQRKEVMLHLPMESETGNKLGPGGLTADMQENEFKNTMRRSINAIPYVRGFNNHMGSRITKDSKLMRWIMQMAMFRDDLYFVDSRTTSESVAMQEAHRYNISGTQRDIFLDYEKNNPAIVEEQLELLVKKARKNGTALAIGHPYQQTLNVLEKWLPKLKQMGIELVPVSQLIAIRKLRSERTWQLSSSPLPKVVKNSKP